MFAAIAAEVQSVGCNRTKLLCAKLASIQPEIAVRAIRLGSISSPANEKTPNVAPDENNNAELSSIGRRAPPAVS
jgi:hypothetical protein